MKGGRHPRDVLGGIKDGWEVRRDSRRPQPDGVSPRPFAEVAAEVTAAFGGTTEALLGDGSLDAFEAQLAERMEGGADRAFPPEFNASRTLGRLCWLTVRTLRPRTVLEIGVAAGLTSSYLAAALEANGEGMLHSIDPEPSDDIGWLVPTELRGRQTLHRGRSRRLLPQLAKRLGGIETLVQDGLHTEPTMTWELSTAARHLAAPAAVLADDVEMNPSFANWAGAGEFSFWSLVETEHPGHVCGLALAAG